MKILMIVLVAIFALIADGYKEPTKIPTTVDESFKVLETWEKDMPDKPEDKDIPSINAEKLLCKISDNYLDPEAKKEVESTLNKTYIRLTGKITRMHMGYTMGNFITIHQQRKNHMFDGWISIHCYFLNTTQIENLKNYKEGDEIVIIGYFYIDSIGPKMYRCEIQ